MTTALIEAARAALADLDVSRWSSNPVEIANAAGIAADTLRAAIAAAEQPKLHSTMAEQFIAVVAGIWHLHPEYSIRQTMDALNVAFPVAQPMDMSPHQHAVDDWRLHGGPGDPRPVAQPVGEPVSVVWKLVPVEPTPEMVEVGRRKFMTKEDTRRWWAECLAASPAAPAHAPLTDEQIDDAHRRACGRHRMGAHDFYRVLARAIERAHGIGSQP